MDHLLTLRVSNKSSAIGWKQCLADQEIWHHELDFSEPRGLHLPVKCDL